MGRFLVTYILLVLRVAWKHRPVQAPGPGVTAVFLTFLVLAQGVGGYKIEWYPHPPCACTALSKHGVGVEPPF